MSGSPSPALQRCPPLRACFGAFWDLSLQRSTPNLWVTMGLSLQMMIRFWKELSYIIRVYVFLLPGFRHVFCRDVSHQAGSGGAVCDTSRQNADCGNPQPQLWAAATHSTRQNTAYYSWHRYKHECDSFSHQAHFKCLVNMIHHTWYLNVRKYPSIQ